MTDKKHLPAKNALKGDRARLRLIAGLSLCGSFLHSLVVNTSPAFAQEPQFRREIAPFAVLRNGELVQSAFGGGLSESKPVLADIDADGDLDLFVGEADGTVDFYRNTGSQATFAFTFESDSIAAIPVGLGEAAPALADFDADGDLDLFIGTGSPFGSAGQIVFYLNAGTPTEPSFVFVTDSLAGVDVREGATPTFVDIDADGDLDLFVGEFFGNINFYRNVGTASKPVLVLETETFAGIDVGTYSVPTFADIDADGDLDLFIGKFSGISFYENVSVDTLAFLLVTDTFAGIDVGRLTAPFFDDLDGDGDLDLLVGEGGFFEDGNINFFRNVGIRSQPSFVQETNTFVGIDVGDFNAPTLADIDLDGDLDLIMGDRRGDLTFYRNIGTPDNPIFSFDANTFSSIAAQEESTPVFADLDNDGDLDLVMGEFQVESSTSNVSFYRNDGPTTNPRFALISTRLLPVDVGNPTAPYLTDIDGDLDSDLFIGDGNGVISFFRNTGSVDQLDFSTDTLAGLSSIAAEGSIAPTLSDIDFDGDLDLFVGNVQGRISFYRNTGSQTAPVFTLQTSALGEIDAGLQSKPILVDIDNDRDQDLFIGERSGGLHFYRNVSAPRVRVPVTDVSFGRVHVDSTVEQALTLFNDGPGLLRVLNITSDNPRFTPLPTTFDITPGDSSAVTLTFTPADSGQQTGALVISSDDPDQDIVIVTLAGVGTIRRLSVQPDTLRFGNVLLGLSESLVVVLTNTGNEPATITSLSPLTDDFLLLDPPAPPFALSAGRDTTLAVQFRPTATGDRSDTLRIGNDSDNTGPVKNVVLSGTGEVVDLVVRPTAHDFGAVTVGLQTVVDIVIQNQGTVELQVDSTAIIGVDALEFAIESGGAPFTVPEGDSHTVAVSFSPRSSGPKSAALNIQCPIPAKDPVDVPLTGTGISLATRAPTSVTSSRDIPIRVTLPPNVGFDRMQLFFRKGGQRHYQSTDLVQDGTDFLGTIPADSVGIRGIEYYLELASDDGEQVLTFPENNARSSPATIGVEVARFSAPLSFEPLTYKMISVPATLAQPSIDSVLFDDYGEYDANIWRLLRWQEATDGETESAYLEFPFPDSQRVFTPGMAFWINSRFGVGFDIENGTSTPTDTPFVLTLDPGWNQIGNPLAFPVAWDSIDTGGLVEKPQFFNDTTFVPQIDILQPWQGYFVFSHASAPTILAVPPVEAPGATSGLPKQASGQGLYTLQLSAYLSDRIKDSYNFIGLRESAREGRDRHDFLDPPPVGPFVRVAILQGGNRFGGNFRPPQGPGQTWEIEISSSLAHRTIRIDLIEQGRLPEGYELFILDQDQKQRIPTRENSFTLQLGAAFAVRNLTVLLGTRAYAEQHGDGIPLVPLQFGLQQNYPNPFNPETTILYQVSQRGRVRLDLFNLLGQKVRTLIDGMQSPGQHAVTWDGRDDSGKPVASGVYLYRLRAENMMAARKLALIR
ncbi:MAG: FG-GAP-like repeat-containing protein [bacterium]